MKTIYLSNGKGVLVDDIDYEYLNQFPWWDNGHFAYRMLRKEDGRLVTIYMHKEIAQRCGIEGNIRHLDDNWYNNQRANLSSKTHPDIYELISGGWRVEISYKGSDCYVGTYDTYEEALIGHTEARQRHADFLSRQTF